MRGASEGRGRTGALVATSAIASVGLVIVSPRAWPLWITGMVALLPWVPLFSVGAANTYRRLHWLALFYVLAVTQSVHFLEHVAQMVQMHVLNLQGPAARGVFGMLDIEWVHFLWNAWVLIAALVLVRHFPANQWLLFTALFSIWHGLEHAYIMSVYLGTGVSGTPGFLSQGGILLGGLPLSRPDLHFLYNLIETVLLAIAFLSQVRRTPLARGSLAPAT
jgi:hypothetical protein